MNYLIYVLKMLNLPIKKFKTYVSNEMQENSERGKIKYRINFSQKKVLSDYLSYGFLCIFIIFIPMFFLLYNPVNFFNVEIKKINHLFVLEMVLIIIFINIIYILIRQHIVYKKNESKPSNLNIYNRDLPEKLTPAHMRLLVENGKFDSKTLTSTILDLIDRGYLELATENREDIFKKNITISKTNKSHEDLFGYEKYLINWLFTENSITSNEMKEKLNNVNENASDHIAIFEGLLLVSFPLSNYYKKTKKDINKYVKICMIVCFFGYLLLLISALCKNIILFGFSEFIILYFFGNALFNSSPYYLNEKGVEIRDGFLDLKRFLEDFSLINEKTSEMIILWNFYLSYAIALGIKTVAFKEINDFFDGNEYNFNSISHFDETEIKSLIENIPEEITNSKEIYIKRGIIISL